MTENDPFEGFKARQRETWSRFAPVAQFTLPPAARLVRFADVAPGQAVLDVATGTGVVAVTAARQGARVSGLDLTPELVAMARENAAVAQVDVDFREGDAEALPYPDASFDVVLSQYGHIFAPRPARVTAELLRVLRPGGVIAFATWPEEHFVGRFFALSARFAPAPPPGFSPPQAWGEPRFVREQLGDAVEALRFERDVMWIHVLSLQHYLRTVEESVAPARALVAAGDRARLAQFREALLGLAAEYYEGNSLRQDYLLARARKK